MIGTINLDYFLKIAHIGVIFIGTIVVGVIALYLKHIKGAHIKILSQNPILKVADRYYITAVNNGLKTGILFEINVKVGYMDINDLFKNKEEGINKPFTIEAGKFEQIYFKLSEDQIGRAHV